jgi:hypothetical protein
MLQIYIKIFYQKVKINFFIRKVLFIFAEIKYKIMTPKEKAKELIEKYDCINFEISAYKNWVEAAKQCALIAIDLAIEYNDFHIEFLQEVKAELLKL